MKYLITILILLALVLPATAQEYDFDQWLLGIDGTYYRVDHTPVRVCAGELAPGWLPVLREGVRQFNTVVRTRLVSTNCDIVVNTTPDIFCPGGQNGCARPDEGSFYPVSIYILQDNPDPLPVMLHELMHAFGVWQHPTDAPSVLNGAWHTLMGYDVAILQYLYSQPAFSRAEISANKAAVAAYFAPQCAWIEAHKDELVNYEKYRC